MPHLTLEYSDNIIETDFAGLFERCHTLLTNQLPTQLASCKSRALKHADYYIGDGKRNNAFVSLTIKIMSGRTPELLQKLGIELIKILESHFSSSLSKLNCQITLEIAEVSKFYFKSTSSLN
jgi:5-carboxymethyl-2-hydroxymuconate isomerase